jgi:hypothetical protein
VSRVAAALVVALLAGVASSGDAPPPAPSALAGADPAARIARAQELKKKDAQGVAKALAALGADKDAVAADRDFLEQYAAQERDRALRCVALETLAKLDRKGAAQWFREHADGKDVVSTVACLEALGRLGDKDDAAAAIALMKNPDEWVASYAADCAARLGASRDVDDIVEVGLAHPSVEVSDHAAWAVQDILKKPKLAVAVFERWAAKKGDTKLQVRAQSEAMLLKDQAAKPHDWDDAPKGLVDLVVKAPAAIEIKTTNEEYRKNALAALDWMRTNTPGAELLVRAAAKRIDIPGAKHPDQDWFDFDQDAIDIPVTIAVWPPHKMALHLFWAASVLWEKRTGAPCTGHRGWVTPIYDSYDLCSVAHLYDAGPGGTTRARFVKDQIDRKPWGGQ